MRRAARPIAAVVRGIDEELRFLQQLQGAVAVRRVFLAEKLPGLEQVFGEFAPRILVPEYLRIAKADRELSDDLLRLVRDLRVLLLHQSLRRAQHRGVRGLSSVAHPSGIQQELRFEQFTLARRQGEVGLALDLSGALAGAHVGQRELARIAPVAVIRPVRIMSRNHGQIGEQVWP